MKGRWIPVWFLVALLVAACSSGQGPRQLPNGQEVVGQVVQAAGGGSYLDILPSELAELLEEDVYLVNVHVPYEGEIPGTDAHVPFDEIAERLGDFPAHKDDPVVLYCRSGSMSAIAARELVARGYTNLFNLDGGFRAWEGAGYEFNP